MHGDSSIQGFTQKHRLWTETRLRGAPLAFYRRPPDIRYNARMSRRLQFSIADGLLATAVVAAVVATISTREAVVSFITLSALLAFLWHRPVLFRLWAATAMGLGSGLLVAMLRYHNDDHQYLWDFRMYSNEAAGWGAGLLVGGAVAYRAFISNPPPPPTDG